MNFYLNLALVLVIGYLLGSANTSIIVSRFYGVDIRQKGSGNAGLTNTFRTLGKLAALLVAMGDILKGVLACLIGQYLVGGQIGLMAAGCAAIVGHNWPVYFGFKGGKGALTSISVVMIMDTKLGLIVFLIFIVVVAITRYVSLGSILGAVIFPILSVFPVFKKDMVFTIFAAFLALMVILRHHANIKRLLNGTESKFGQKKNA